MTQETADDARPRDKIHNENNSEADLYSKGILNGTLIDHKETEDNNNDTKLRCKKENNANSSLRVVYLSMTTTMTGVYYQTQCMSFFRFLLS